MEFSTNSLCGFEGGLQDKMAKSIAAVGFISVQRVWRLVVMHCVVELSTA